MTKPWYYSKTILIGIAEIAIGTVLAVVNKEATGAAGIALVICGAVQAILRLVTKQPVG